MFNGWVLSQFEGAFTKMAILVTFIPMLMGTGGNVGISIFTLVNQSEIIGGVLPLIAKKLNLDPALMASPLISSITDTASLVIYFTIAKLILGL